MTVLLLGAAGYIGSALFPSLLDEGHPVRPLDAGWFSPVLRPRDYGRLGAADLEGVESVVVLAGHSSVAMCGSREAAYANNTTNLRRLLALAGQRQVVYASTAGVYGKTAGPATEDQGVCASVFYDDSKLAAEAVARDSGCPVVCLRFGTVCGGAPHLRVDLLLNRMAHDAQSVGRVTVTTPTVWRPVLGLRDLCRAVGAILRGPRRAEVYNLASFNATVGDLAETVAARYRVPLRRAGGASPYDMRLDCSRFQRDYGFSFEEDRRSILASVDRRYRTAHKTTRTEARPYG